MTFLRALASGGKENIPTAAGLGWPGGLGQCRGGADGREGSVLLPSPSQSGPREGVQPQPQLPGQEGLKCS